MTIVLAQADLSKAIYTCTLGDGDGKADASVRLGATAKTDILVPNINASKWSDEFFVNLNPEWFVVSKSATMDFRDNVCETTVGDCKITSKVYDNGLEYAFWFSSAPTGDYIRIRITQTSGLEWAYQPELTQEEIDAGHEIPEKVVGSFAVYAPVAHNKYKTGKVMHAYNPVFIDADGKSIRSKGLVLDGDELLIPNPVDWFKTAKFPVCCVGGSDTFGYTTAGATNAEVDYPRCNCHSDFVHTAGSGENIIKYSAYCKTYSSGLLGMAVYSMSGDNPQNRLADVVTINTTNSTAAWRDSAAISQAMSNGTSYGVACGDSSGAPRIYYDTVAPTVWSSDHNASGDCPSTWTEAATRSDKLSIYATWEAAAGGLSITKDGAITPAGAITRLGQFNRLYAGAI